jgi:hypothetical protein
LPEISLTVGGGDAVLDWLSASIAKRAMPHIILMDLKAETDGLAVAQAAHACRHARYSDRGVFGGIRGRR